MDSTDKIRHPKYYADIQARRDRLSKISVPNLLGEEWKDVPEYEGFYKISSLFRIKSVCRLALRQNGKTIIKKEQLIRPAKNSDGYLCLVLTKERVTKTYSVHVLMGNSFVHNPFNLPEINHLDGDKLNCLPNNLEWSDRKNNIGHAIKTGLRKYKKGINTGRYKIPNVDILLIYNSKEKTKVIANKYNVTRSAIQRIRNGKTYANITKHGIK